MLAGDLLDEQVLRPVGVLVFVHHHVVELVRVALANRGVLIKELDGRQEQVVEIERARVLQRLDVALEQLADFAILRIPGVREGLRALHAVLRVADAAEHHPRLVRLGVEVIVLEQLLDDGLLIGGVVDREIAAQADVVRLATQQARAQRVEGRHPHRAAVRVEQPLDALAHFLGGLVGEGDRHDLIGIRNFFGDEIGDAMRDDARLSRACAGENQQRTVRLADGFLLRRI